MAELPTAPSQTPSRKEPVIEMTPDPNQTSRDTGQDAGPLLPKTTDPAAIPPANRPAPRSDSEEFTPLARIEDKTARIEEKFARSEERMVRVESALEKATLRLEGATHEMNLQGLRDEVAAMRADLRRKPGVVTLFVVALIASLIGAAVGYALTRLGTTGTI